MSNHDVDPTVVCGLLSAQVQQPSCPRHLYAPVWDFTWSFKKQTGVSGRRLCSGSNTTISLFHSSVPPLRYLIKTFHDKLTNKIGEEGE